MQSGVSGSQRARPRLIFPALYRITAEGNNPSKRGGVALQEEQTRSVEASVFLWQICCHSTCSLLIYEGADKITIRASIALTRETQVERIGETQFSLSGKFSGVRQLRKGKCKR
jgi:hypothetical protein